MIPRPVRNRSRLVIPGSELANGENAGSEFLDMRSWREILALAVSEWQVFVN